MLETIALLPARIFGTECLVFAVGVKQLFALPTYFEVFERYALLEEVSEFMPWRCMLLRHQG